MSLNRTPWTDRQILEGSYEGEHRYNCAACSGKITPEDDALDLDEGGIIHDACRTAAHNVYED